MPTREGRPRQFLLPALLVVLVGAGTVVHHQAVVVATPLAPGDGRPGGIVRTIQATTSTGRQGAYYLPRADESAALPLLVILHGTRGKGSLMILRLQSLADRERFIVVAPDSVSVAGAWLVGQGARGPTEDHRHVVTCVREVLAAQGVRVDRARLLLAGFSAGGGAAAYIASHEDLFTAFAVLHGHVVLDGLGPRRVRGWLSTGDRDRLRTVGQIAGLADHLRRREGFRDIETRVFPGDHTLDDAELSALIAWWLR